MIDTHIHLLPCIDDGPKTKEEALASAKLLEEKGITKLIMTPHSDGASVTKEDIMKCYENFNQILKDNNSKLEIYPGSEVKLGSNTAELLRDGKLMTVNNDERYILIELPNDNVSFFIINVIKQIKSLGTIPIIAHPERNRILMQQKDLMQELLDIGVLFQLNSGSLSGYFGSRVKGNAKRLVKEGLVNLLGSDCHGINHTRPDIITGYNHIKDLVGAQTAQNISFENPKLLLEKSLNAPVIRAQKGIKDIFLRIIGKN